MGTKKGGGGCGRGGGQVIGHSSDTMVSVSCRRNNHENDVTRYGAMRYGVM